MNKNLISLLAGTSLLIIFIFPIRGFSQKNDLNNGVRKIQVKSLPDGVLVTIKGEYEIHGRAPFYLPFPLNGRYSVQASKNGYENWSSKKFFSNNSENIFIIHLKKKTRAKAAVRSLLFPGWGHYYTGRKFGGIFFTSTVALAGAYAIFTQFDYKDEVDSFNRLKDQLTTLSPEELQQLNRQYGKIDDADTRRKRAFIVVGSLWALNILDSVIFFPDYGRGASSSKKQIQVSQDFSMDSVKLGLSLIF